MKDSFAHFVRAARRLCEQSDVPYSFEQRVMAKVRRAAPEDLWTVWMPAMWKAAFCGLCVLGATIALARFAEANSTDLLASDLERTVLASVDSEETW